MPKYFKPQCTGGKLLPVVFEDQIRPGSFEYALSHLLDQFPLDAFEARYRNEAWGASAYLRAHCSRSCCSRTRAG